MLNREQSELIKRNHSVRVRYDPKLDYYGCSTMELQNSKVVPVVILKDKLLENDQQLTDMVLVHEYGHIDYGHLQVNMNEQVDKINKILPKLGVKEKLTKNNYNTIVNIAMDIQINSTLWSFPQLNYAEAHGWKFCTADAYEVEPGLNFPEYYEPVIKKIKDRLETEEESEKSLAGILEELQELLDQFEGNFAQNAQELQAHGLSDGDSELIGSAPGTKDEFSESPNEDPTDSDNPDQGDGIGFGSATSDLELKEPAKETTVAEVIKELMSINKSYDIVYDSNIIANRRSRGNTPLRYTSMRRIRKRTEVKRILFVVDISGSMSTSTVVEVVQQVRKNASLVDPRSGLVLWNTGPALYYPINDIPGIVGGYGGTELSGSVRYAKERNFDTVLLISDIGTDHHSFKKELEKAPEIEYDILAYDVGETYIENLPELPLIKHIWWKTRSNVLKKFK